MPSRNVISLKALSIGALSVTIEYRGEHTGFALLRWAASPPSSPFQTALHLTKLLHASALLRSSPRCLWRSRCSYVTPSLLPAGRKGVSHSTRHDDRRPRADPTSCDAVTESVCPKQLEVGSNSWSIVVYKSQVNIASTILSRRIVLLYHLALYHKSQGRIVAYRKGAACSEIQSDWKITNRSFDIKEKNDLDMTFILYIRCGDFLCFYVKTSLADILNEKCRGETAALGHLSVSIFLGK